MAQCGDFGLCNKYFVATFTVAAFSHTGCGTGRLNCLRSDLLMSQCGHFGLRNKYFVAPFAMGAFSQAGFGTGGLHSFVSYFVMSFCGINDFNDLSAIAGSREKSVLGAGRLHAEIHFEVFFVIHYFVEVNVIAFSGPLTVGVSVFTVSTDRTCVAACIPELCRRDRDLHNCAGARLLICIQFIARTQHYYTGAIGADICAAVSGINMAFGCIKSAVYQYLCIDQIRLGTVVAPACSKLQRQKHACAGSAVSAPLISVIYIDILAGSKFAGRAAVDNDLGTGQERYILIDGYSAAAVDNNSNVTVYRKLIFRRVKVNLVNKGIH